jgi:hypothetical protein
MVIKYVGLSAIIYGLHAFLALTQVLLCLFLAANGKILLSDKKQLGKWSNRFGLTLNKRLSQSSLNGWFMILTGVALILPLLGLSYWIAVIACPVSIYWIMALKSGADNIVERKKSTGWVQKGLMIGAVFVFGFTLWEGKDLIRASAVITYKAAYWEMTEVMGWQKTNNPNVPKVGEAAPDFELTDVTGTKTVRLSDFRGKKPVVLLFGSFT